MVRLPHFCHAPLLQLNTSSLSIDSGVSENTSDSSAKGQALYAWNRPSTCLAVSLDVNSSGLIFGTSAGTYFRISAPPATRLAKAFSTDTVLLNKRLRRSHS